VLGGTPLAGGRFFLVGSLLGALIIQTLSTTILHLHVAPEVIRVVKGTVVLVVAIAQSPRFKAILSSRLSRLRGAR
jgi:galactofuranose transport system permease protein